jgi:hypothetical protein
MSRLEIAGLFVAVLLVLTAQVFTFTPYLTQGLLALGWLVAGYVLYLTWSRP